MHTFNPTLSKVAAAALAFALIASLSLPRALAAATLSLSAPVANASNYAVTITVDTGGVGVSGVDLHLTLPSGVGYVSNDASSSVFGTEVTAPNVSGSDLHVARVTLAAAGYTGTNGTVTTLVFSGSQSAVQQVAVNAATTQVASTSGANILGSSTSATPEPTAAPSATATPAPTATAAPATATPVPRSSSLPATGSDLAIPLALISIGMIALSLYELRRNGNRSS